LELAQERKIGHLELVLAERVGLLSWRLHCATRYETESITLFQESAEDDLAGRRRFDSRALGAAHPEDVRSNLKMGRSDYRLLKRFKDDIVTPCAGSRLYGR
jgi:hypothetical protein